MKKSLFLLYILCSSALLYAQTDDEIVITGSNKITRQATPKQVIDSLHKRFPNAQAVQYYQTSPEAVKAGWAVSEDDNLTSGENVGNYTLSFKRNDFKYYALYDANGHLLMSKYQDNTSKVPAAVKESVKSMLGGDNYKNYTLLSKEYYKKVDHDKQKEYYEIRIANKNDKSDKKTITLAPDGTILKEKG